MWLGRDSPETVNFDEKCELWCSTDAQIRWPLGRGHSWKSWLFWRRVSVHAMLQTTMYPFIASLLEIYFVSPQASGAMSSKSRTRPVSHWTEKLDWVLCKTIRTINTLLESKLCGIFDQITLHYRIEDACLCVCVWGGAPIFIVANIGYLLMLLVHLSWKCFSTH